MYKLNFNYNSKTIDESNVIVLANIKFKIISKILVDRLASIMPIIISDEQKGFVKGRSIKYYKRALVI